MPRIIQSRIGVPGVPGSGGGVPGPGSVTQSMLALDVAADINRAATQRFDIRAYGAVSGAADSSAAFVAADAAATAVRGTVFIPPGDWRLTSEFFPSNFANYQGVGQTSHITFNRGYGRAFDLTNKLFVRFSDLRLTNPSAYATGFYVANAFRCSWNRVVVDGTNQVGALADLTLRGFEFRDNAGDNRLIDCDLNNLGTGIETDTVMNYMIGGTIGSCRTSISGGDTTGVNYRAGMSVSGTTFVGTVGATEYHLRAAGSSAEWWFNSIWMEKVDNAVLVGNTVGGARSLSIRSAYMAGKFSCLNIVNARQPTLDDITFSSEVGDTPVELSINSTYALNGSARNLRSSQVYDFPDATFPSGWDVYTRDHHRFPTSVVGSNATLSGVLTVGGSSWRSGSGSPEGVITASVGSLYSRTDTGALYRKTSGTGNTGWVTP